jgi:methyl-accepting chemotaxis protein
MKWNLSTRIVVPTALLVAAVTATVAIVSFTMSRRNLATALDTQLQDLTGSVVTSIEDWVKNQQLNAQHWAGDADVLAALTESSEMTQARSKVCQDFVRAKATLGNSEAINLVDTTGLVIAGSATESIGRINISERPYFKTTMAGTPTVSDVLKSSATGNPIIVVAAPVMDGTKVRGVLINAIDLHSLSQRAVGSIKVLQTGYAFMFDQKGMILAHPKAELIMKTKIDEFDWGRQVLAQHDGLMNYSYDGLDKELVFRTSKTLGWGIAINVPQAELTAPVRHMTTVIATIGTAALLIGIALAFFTARAIAKPLTEVASQLTATSEQTAAAAQQVSSASNQLATGATQQAASLEESSSSLEELSSMTQNNTDHAREANDLAREARAAAEAGAQDMTQMGKAMEDIKASSGDIKKIVKTIDEIAFQTNILALNAAVEAARAGEAGAGFAVVAEEVRNLAQRSAQAAKETADMVEGAIAKTEHGATLSTKVGQSLQEIVAKVRRVDELVTEVATASGEQSQGVKQINTAVAEMDKLTQSNAATAEESASAAHELSAQAEHLKLAVSNLIALVEGGHAEQAPSAATTNYRSDPAPAAAPARPALAPAKRTQAPKPASVSDNNDAFFT